MKTINEKEYSVIGTNEEENIWYMSRDSDDGEEDEYGEPVKIYVVAWGKEIIQSDTDVDNGHEGILYFDNDSKNEAFGTFIFKMNNLGEDEDFLKFASKFN